VGPNLKVYTCPSSTPNPISQVGCVRFQTGGVPGRDFPNPVNPAEGFPSPLTPFNAYAVTGPPGVSTQPAYGRGNYLAMGGFLVPNSALGELYKGMFTFNVRNRIVTINDGTSNTVAFLESIGGYVNTGNANSTGWWGNSYAMNMQLSAFGMCPNRNNGNCNFTDSGARGFGFALPGSNHAENRINTLFGDGSVRALNPTMDFTTYVYICGMADGQVVTFE
jgi:prepilin-type processing-associated H-X9-DG protein